MENAAEMSNALRASMAPVEGQALVPVAAVPTAFTQGGFGTGGFGIGQYTAPMVMADPTNYAANAMTDMGVIPADQVGLKAGDK